MLCYIIYIIISVQYYIMITYYNKNLLLHLAKQCSGLLGAASLTSSACSRNLDYPGGNAHANRAIATSAFIRGYHSLAHTHRFSKVCFIMNFFSKYTRALLFLQFMQKQPCDRQPAAWSSSSRPVKPVVTTRVYSIRASWCCPRASSTCASCTRTSIPASFERRA